DPQREERKVETSRRARYGEGVLGPLQRGELLLEGVHLGSHRQPLAGDDALDGCCLFAPVIEVTQRNTPITQGESPPLVRRRFPARAHSRPAARYRATSSRTASRRPSRRLR